jgi:hypothetical protein
MFMLDQWTQWTLCHTVIVSDRSVLVYPSTPVYHLYMIISTTFKLASPTPTPVSPLCTFQAGSHRVTSSGQVGIKVDDQAVGIRAVSHLTGFSLFSRWTWAAVPRENRKRDCSPTKQGEWAWHCFDVLTSPSTCPWWLKPMTRFLWQIFYML